MGIAGFQWFSEAFAGLFLVHDPLVPQSSKIK